MEKTFGQSHPRRLTLEEYQRRSGDTATYPGRSTFLGILYCSLKLNGEAGEVAEKVGKVMRDEEMVLQPIRKEALILELGDVLWYIQQLATEFGVSLETVAMLNLEKLARRKINNTLSGSGDNR